MCSVRKTVRILLNNFEEIVEILYVVFPYPMLIYMDSQKCSGLILGKGSSLFHLEDFYSDRNDNTTMRIIVGFVTHDSRLTISIK